MGARGFTLAETAEVPSAPAGETVPAATGDAPPDPAVDEFEGFDAELGPGDGTGPAETFDPLRGFNRGMYWFNDRMYFWVLKPTARVYGAIVPKPVRSGIQRVFKNARFPVRFVNSALQGKGRGALRETGRFLVNSTLGVGGFFDPARAWLRWEPSEEDFGQTLGRYGVGTGVPLVLPLIGPTNLRDIVGFVPDYFLDPIAYLDPHDPQFINRTRVAVKSGEVVNRTSLEIGKYESVKKDALDPYTFMRDAYRQMRDEKIKE